MKRENGVTMIAVTVYVMVLAIIIGIIANISTFFYKNVSNVKQEGKQAAEFNNFDLYFKKEFEKKGNKIEKIDTSKYKSYIIFESGNQYVYKDNGVYMNSVKICDNVSDMEFEKYTHFDKTIVKVHMVIGEYNEFDKTIEYILEK